jgi:hypothetical protein
VGKIAKPSFIFINHHTMSAEIELLKEQQRSKQLYEMCENLWQTLNAVNIIANLPTAETHIVTNCLKTNNPSKLKRDDK